MWRSAFTDCFHLVVAEGKRVVDEWQFHGRLVPRLIGGTAQQPLRRQWVSVEDILRCKISPRIDQHSPDAQKRELLMYGPARFNADRLIKRGHCHRRTCTAGTGQSSSVTLSYDTGTPYVNGDSPYRLWRAYQFNSSLFVHSSTRWKRRGEFSEFNLANSNYHLSSSLLLGFPQNWRRRRKDLFTPRIIRYIAADKLYIMWYYIN